MSKTRSEKREEATQRQETYDLLTPLQRLHKLIAFGHGHCEEGRRLLRTIATEAEGK